MQIGTCWGTKSGVKNEISLIYSGAAASMLGLRRKRSFNPTHAKTVDSLTFKEVLEMAAMRNHRDTRDTRPNECVSKLQTDRQTDSQKATNKDRQNRREQAKEELKKKKGEGEGKNSWLQKQ